MDKAISKILVDQVMPIKEGDEHYDFNFYPFEPLIKQMNEMGCPITMDDLIQITEDRISGTRTEPKHEPHLRYTYIFKKN